MLYFPLILSCTLSIKWQISTVWLRDLHNICAISFVYIYIFLVTIIKIFVLNCIVLYMIIVRVALYCFNIQHKWPAE